jgi:hypothetical protein
MREPYIVNKLHYRYLHIDFSICHLHLKDAEKEHTNGIVVKVHLPLANRPRKNK